MPRRVVVECAFCFALLALSGEVAKAEDPPAGIPLAVTVLEQTLTYKGCGGDVTTSTGPGSAPVELPVDETCPFPYIEGASTSVRGAFTSSNLGGAIVLSFAGTLDSNDWELRAGTGPATLTGMLRVRVPETIVLGARLATTPVLHVAELSTPSPLLARVYGAAGIPDLGTDSSFAGPGVHNPGFYLDVVDGNWMEVRSERRALLLDHIGGDEATYPFYLTLDLENGFDGLSSSVSQSIVFTLWTIPPVLQRGPPVRRGQ